MKFLRIDVDGVQVSLGQRHRRRPVQAGEAVARADLDDQFRVRGQRDVIKQIALDARDLPRVVARFAQGVELLDELDDLRVHLVANDVSIARRDVQPEIKMNRWLLKTEPSTYSWD